MCVGIAARASFWHLQIQRLKPELLPQQLTVNELIHWQLQLCKSFVQEQRRIRAFVGQIEQLIRIPVMADFIIFSILICFLFFALTVGVSFSQIYILNSYFSLFLIFLGAQQNGLFVHVYLSVCHGRDPVGISLACDSHY